MIMADFTSILAFAGYLLKLFATITATKRQANISNIHPSKSVSTITGTMGKEFSAFFEQTGK